MKMVMIVALLGFGMTVVSCKAKAPKLDPNSEGGPIAAAPAPDTTELPEKPAIAASAAPTHTSPSEPAAAAAAPTPDTTELPGKPAIAASAGPTHTSPSKPAALPCSTSSADIEDLELPAGVPVVIRLKGSLSSKLNNTGDQFFATVIKPVVLEEETVIPPGALALGTVTSARSLETPARKPLLALRLNTVCFGGRVYSIQASRLVGTSIERPDHGGAMIGGLLGAFPGAGRGTAGVGAAAGAASPAGRDVVLPSDSTLTFSTEKTEYARPGAVQQPGPPQ